MASPDPFRLTPSAVAAPGYRGDMNHEFWHERWHTGQIGFHHPDVHDDLQREGERWLGGDRPRVLVPLCGKSHDLAWLAERAEVLGVELVETAVLAFFDERGLVPERWVAGPFTAFSAPELPGLTILQGDVFALVDLDATWRLDTITHVWDRAALVALTRSQRAAYAAMLRRVVPGARVLLNVFDIGPDNEQGPPHSVQQAELEVLFAGCPMALTHSAISEPSPGLKARGLTELLTLTWEVELRPPG